MVRERASAGLNHLPDVGHSVQVAGECGLACADPNLRIDMTPGAPKFYYSKVIAVEEEMKARHLIDSASYGPDALKALGEAFDAAWQEIAGNFGDDPRDIELARARLATALLSVACEESPDVEALKVGALQAMALVYREPQVTGPQISS